MPEMKKINNIVGHQHFRYGCVDHARLPNFVIAAFIGFICFWRKMKAFRPLEGRRCDEIQ